MNDEIEKQRLDYFEQISEAGGIIPTDREELLGFLRNGAFQRVLHEILIESDAQSKILLGMDFTNTEHLARASKAQGYAQGLARAIEYIIETALPYKEENE